MNSSKAILLIEDNKTDQLLFIEALREIKNSNLYGIANNGKEALDMLESSVVLPHLIFMDINMPVMNGIECLKEIKKKHPVKNIPVVILSSATNHIGLVRKLGATAFLEKSNDYNTLCEQLEHVIKLDLADRARLPNQFFQIPLAV